MYSTMTLSFILSETVSKYSVYSQLVISNILQISIFSGESCTVFFLSIDKYIQIQALLSYDLGRIK